MIHDSYCLIERTAACSDSCGIMEKMTGLVSNCVGEYDIYNDERQDFGPRWTKSEVDAVASPEYIYRTAEELDGLPYYGECH